ncbi:MAG: serine hydrolase domain-containing protein [Pseudomonadota bacterium]
MIAPADLLHHWCTVHDVPGAQLAVSTGETVEFVCHGVANTSLGNPVTSQTRFQIGSVTKPMLAFTAFRLAEAGVIDLDKTVASVLQNLRQHKSLTSPKLSIRHLMDHSSGLPGDMFLDLGDGPEAGAALLKATNDVAALHPVGAEASYCNYAYVALGEVIAATTRTHWTEAFKSLLIEPLGSATLDPWPADDAPNLVIGHAGGAPVDCAFLAKSNAAAGTTPIGTAADLARFGTLLLNSLNGAGPLAEDNARAMTEMSAKLAPNERGDGFGQGFMVMEWDGVPVFGHDGLTIGQRAFLRVFPNSGMSVGLLGNGGDLRGLYQDLFADLAGVTGQPPPPRLRPSNGVGVSARDGVCGRYDRPNASLLVRNQDGRLTLEVLNHEPWAEFAYGAVEGPFPMASCGPHQCMVNKPGSNVPLMVSFGQDAAWHGMRRYNRSAFGGAG